MIWSSKGSNLDLFEEFRDNNLGKSGNLQGTISKTRIGNASLELHIVQANIYEIYIIIRQNQFKVILLCNENPTKE